MKWLVLLVDFGIIAATAITRRWALLQGPWPFVGAAIALAVWTPNLLWQAANGCRPWR